MKVQVYSTPHIYVAKIVVEKEKKGIMYVLLLYMYNIVYVQVDMNRVSPCDISSSLPLPSHFSPTSLPPLHCRTMST